MLLCMTLLILSEKQIVDIILEVGTYLPKITDFSINE